MIRKITSAEEKKAREEKNKKIIVIILGLIMLMSSAGYFANDLMANKTQKFNYNGVEFQETEYSSWKMSLQGQSFEMKYNPFQTVNVSNKITKNLGDYVNKPLYFAVEPELSNIESSQEILININGYLERVGSACITQNCTGDYPEKDCSSNIIAFRLSKTNETRIITDDNCVYIEYIPGEALLGADAFLYRILGLQ